MQFILGGIICLLIYKLGVFIFWRGWTKGYGKGEETMGYSFKKSKKKRRGVKR